MQCRCDEIEKCNQDLVILKEAIEFTESIDVQIGRENKRKERIVLDLPMAEEDEHIEIATEEVDMCGKRQGRSVSSANSAWQKDINDCIEQVEGIKDAYVIEDNAYHASEQND